MEKYRLQLWAWGSALWVIAFAFLIFLIAQDLKTFQTVSDQLDQATQAAQYQAKTIRERVDQTHARDMEYRFLQSLVNVLPQEKGFVRTQRAMGREVEQLRAKIVRRLRQDIHILVDTQANKLYVKRGLSLLWQSDCSVGKGGTLIDKVTGRRWEFVTPRGVFDVLGKIEKPVWTKPDWAFVETGEEVPPPGDPKRRAEGELGGYVLNLGDGYLIHGTKNEAMLGRPASHGCVRLAAADLEKLYKEVPRSARVYIY